MTQRGRCRKFTQINASGGQQPFGSSDTFTNDHCTVYVHPFSEWPQFCSKCPPIGPNDRETNIRRQLTEIAEDLPKVHQSCAPDVMCKLEFNTFEDLKKHLQTFH